MKRRHLIFLFLLVVALLVGGCGLWVWQAKRQYALNRQLIEALVNGDSKQALALVNRGAAPNTRRNPPPAPTLTLLFNQLLHRSSAPADDRPMAFLLACGVRLKAWDSVFDFPPQYPDDVVLVEAMFQHGANLNIQTADRSTALHGAATAYLPHVIEWLIAHHANVNAQNALGTTPLMKAVEHTTPNVVRLLLAHGGDVNITDKEGRPVLFYAVTLKMDKDIIRQLLAKGADPNRRCKNGDTPLRFVQQAQRFDILALLQKGAK